MANTGHNTLLLCSVKVNRNKHFRLQITSWFFTQNKNTAQPWIISALVASNLSQITLFILANVLTSISEGFWPNFDKINISPRPEAIFFFWIVNSLTWQNSPEGGYDEKSWEMACNRLMVTSSGDNIWPSGSSGLVTNKTKKINRRQTMNRPAYSCTVNKISQLDDTWSSDWVVASKAFAHFFTCDRFWALFSNIHLVDNEKCVDRNHQDYDKPLFQNNYSLG